MNEKFHYKQIIKFMHTEQILQKTFLIDMIQAILKAHTQHRLTAIQMNRQNENELI
jgi:hypothetical protein